MQTYFQLSWPHYGLYKLFPLLIIRFLSLWGQTGVKQQKTLSPDRIEFTLMGKQICSKLYYLSKLSLYTLLLSIFFTIKIAAAANDYGDAPSSYGNPTHTISGNLKLGINAPDAETTAATPLDGSGDDKTATDDEDGVASFPTLSAGGPTGSYVIAKTSLSATGTGTLHAWIDFNQDGAFSASEYASTTVTSSVIAANLTWNNITIPANLRGTTYARLRLTSTTLTDNTSTANVDERATAVASNGEVEDYALTISARDYGDAPATYGDASHQITPNLYLGDNLPDAETASKASFNARTDSYDDGAPSQPVSSYIPLFPVLQLTDTHYSADFKVTNVTGTAARLYGWIDFDKSGTFEADEATVVNVPTGSDKALVTLSWATIPADIKLGTTAIRLRLTSDNTVTLNTPTGNASNGEVEDYPLAIAMDIPPNSQALSIVSGATPMACESVVFQDNFNDLPAGMFWGVYRPNAQPIRNWQRAGGGNDTYAHISGTAQYGNNIYFGNGAVRQITPALNDGFQFDANGKLLTLIDAISLRDEMDDYMSPGTTNLDEYGSQSDWGPEPVQLSRSFATTPGKTYRLYFKAIPERPDSGYYMSGIMRLDLPGGSLHFRAPGSNEGEQSYAVEFTASSTTSTLTFLNYGHIEGAQDGWCDPNVVFNGGPWCTVGGSTSSQPANELLIDEVILTESACSMGTISGTVYIDKNRNNNFDSASENGIVAISVSLYDQNGTTTDTSDDRLVATTNTSATGSYSFAYVNASRTYRLQVDTTDPDLPTGAIIGTAMPLMDITVAAGSTTTKQDFGFDLPSGCTTTNTTIYSQNFDSYAMNTWLGQAVTGGSAYYNSTDPTVGGRNGVTQSTWDMQNTSLGASGSGRFLTFWTDNRGPAIPANEHQFYSFQKTVTPNTSYILSFDIGAFNQSPSIQIFINGVSVYGPFAPTSSWKTITIAWDSGSASSIDVDFINNATDLNGNDWAIDNISLVRRDTQCVISGKVFEDVNYGGGVGRNANTVGVRPITGARVELYNSNGAFVSNTTTAADGSYSLNTVSTDNYYVRVVNDTVRSNRTGSNGTERGIQTYRTDGITEVINEVGGRKPTSVDTAANTTNQTLNTSTFQLSAGGQVQSVQLIPANSKDTLGVNFGFNFSTVTNTNDSGQGSLRQAIINANLLGNTGLAQPGSTYGVNTGLSKEVLVFNIPAANDPLSRADICGGSTCKITVTSTLPAISAPLIIDGTTQPGYTAGTPGIPHIQLSPVSGLDAIGLDVAYTAADSTVRGLAITGFRTSAMNRAINVEAERVIVEANYIGLTPAGIADANGYGILLEFTQSAIIGGATSAKRNIISGNLHFGIGYDTGASAGLIQNNFIGTNPTGTAALGNQTGGIDLEGANNTQVLDNVISGNAGDGIQIGFTNGTIITSGYTIQGNRIGVGINGEALGNSGPGIMSYGGSKNHQIGGTETGQGNIIAYNLIGGIRLAANNDNTQNIISANSIYANGNLGIDLNANGVTVNDANDADTGANSLLNFPLLSQLGLNNGMLTLSGCAPAGATVELFEADVSNGGKATVGDNKQGKSKDYGEGQTYLTSFVEGSSSDSNSADCTLPTDTDSNNQTGMKAFTVTTPAPATLAVGDLLTLTATLPTVGTSEFSPAFTLNIPTDFSDAPATYGSPSHTIVAGIYLGNTVPDSEATPVAPLDGTGDDVIGTDDEDAVTIPIFTQGQGTTISVNVTQTSANSGYLQGWIDFNADGDFADAGEQIALNLQYSAGTSGTISVPLTVPTTATTNQTYARFRWSTVQDLNAMTAAKDGEVEDYALTIHIGRKLTGMVFEDINYGGGAGRSKTAASGVGVNSASVELYTSAGKLFASTTTASDGSYTFSYVPDGNYYVRVVNDTVKSTRSGSNGSERGVQTYRSTGGTVVTTEVGGRKPSTVDAGINNTNQTLNTTTFVLSNGGQAQSVQPISVAGSNLSGIDFGFNFSTVVNTNDSGTGSLRQFLLNANLLGDDSRLAQQGRTLGKENAILMLLVSDPNYRATDNYWSIALQSALPAITAPLILDGSLQTGSSNNRPQLELQGSNTGAGSHGLTLTATSSGSNLKHLAINRFGGAGIYLNGSSNNTLQANAIGTDPTGKLALANTGSGIKLAAGASNNLIGGATNGTGNQITNNGGAGIAVTDNTSLNNSLLSNSIYANGGLGIDLGEDGVTENDAGDSDTGPNHRLNYPLINSQGIGSNGTQILTYDLSLDVAAGSYRLEFFTNSAQDSSGHGEGQTYLGAKIITHPGTGAVTLKGTLNTSQSVAAGTLVSITTTAINGNSYGSTSEFSTYQSGTNTTVCQDLTTGSGAQTIMLDENSTSLALLKSKDSQGNPINYVISGGLDQNLFILTPAITATPTQDCSQLKFVQSGIVSARLTSVDASKRATNLPPVGNFELPLDSNRDNVYDVQLTATTADGKSYVRTLDFRILNVNEAPTLGVTDALSVVEESNTKVTTVNGIDPDAGDVLTYSITGGDDASQFSIDAVTGQLTFNAIPNFDAPTDTNRDNTYQLEVTATDREGLRVTRPLLIQVTNNTGDDGIALSTRVWLQGPYNQQTQLMDNTLQLKDLLPVKQPYAAQPFAYNGSEVRSSAVDSATAGDALVDWVLIDIRTNANTIVASKAALLQRDGDVVDAQSGSNWLSFANVPTGNYYVSLRHRNHLGVITASPLNLTQTAKLVDFTSTDTVVAGKETRLTNGKSAWLWAGDANASQTLTVSGPANDINTVVARVLNDPSNTQASTNFAAVGYDNADINLDGSSMFTGPSNDANMLLANILLNGLNTNSVTNFIVKGALAP